MERLEIIELNPNIITLDERFNFWDFIYTSRKEEIIQEIINNKRKMFVGIIDNEYIGGFSITSLDKNQLYMSFLVVKSNYRNNGIGSCFIDFAIKYARQSNADKILIGVLSDNIGAKRLYERKGFIPIDQTDNKITLSMKL